MPKGISETAFSSQVEDLLVRFGWRWLHLKPAKSGKGRWMTRTNKEGVGFFDYLAVRPPRLLFAELKDGVSLLTPEQEAWRDDIEGCIVRIFTEPLVLKGGQASLNLSTMAGEQSIKACPEVYLWRPKDIDEISVILR